MNKILKGEIDDAELIRYIEKDEIISSNNLLLRDGQIYKFNLSTKNLKKEFTIDESNLDDNLKKIIDIAQSKKK